MQTVTSHLTRSGARIQPPNSHQLSAISHQLFQMENILQITLKNVSTFFRSDGKNFYKKRLKIVPAAICFS